MFSRDGKLAHTLSDTSEWLLRNDSPPQRFIKHLSLLHTDGHGKAVACGGLSIHGLCCITSKEKNSVFCPHIG